MHEGPAVLSVNVDNKRLLHVPYCWIQHIKNPDIGIQIVVALPA